MSNRKKKRRRSRSSPPAVSAGNGTKGTAHRQAAVGREQAAAEAKAEPRSGQPPRPLFGSRLREPSPYPSFADTLLRGVLATASSTPAVIVAFAAVLALWAGHFGVGAGDLMQPKRMSSLMAIPPLHVLFLDANIAFAVVPAGSPPVKLLIAVGFTFFRVLSFGVVVALVARRLGWNEERPLGRLARAVPHLALIALALFGLSAAVPFLLLTTLPGGLGQLALLAGPLFGLHFLVFAPVTAVLDGTKYRDAIRLSARAARLPGGSHLAMTFGYFAFTLFAVSLVPQPTVSPATPTVATWAYTLGATFIHVAVMAAFVYRWVAVRDVVPTGASLRPERPARSGRGLLGRLGR